MLHALAALYERAIVNQANLTRFNSIRVRVVPIFKFAILQALRTMGILLVLSVLAVVVYRFAPVPFTPLMVIRTIENFQEKSSFSKVHYKWIPISKIHPHMQSALIAAEDANFLEHSGFDFEAIDKALAQNRKSNGRRVRGASTITQQVAKNLFLWPSRSWIRKIAEAYFTVLIELFWTKERILEVYMNIIETGDGVYGVEAASRLFFRQRADSLSSEQAALIAAVLPNPRKFRINNPSPYTRFRKLAIFRRMRDVAPPFVHN